jgi:hypothetical protein
MAEGVAAGVEVPPLVVTIARGLDMAVVMETGRY